MSLTVGSPLPDVDRQLYRLLGADAVVDRHGRLAYLSLPASPDARPPVQDLVDASR